MILVRDFYREGGGRYIVSITDTPGPVLDEPC